MRIVIVKLSALGDILQTLHIIPRIMAAFPHCTIDWVVEKRFADALRGHVGIDTIITCDSKRLRRHPTIREIKELIRNLRRVTYDVLIDLQGNCKSGCVNLFIRAASKHGFSLSSAAEWPNILSTTHRYDLRSIASIREKNIAMLEKIFNRPFADAKEISLFPLELCEKQILQRHCNQLSQDMLVVMICPFSKWPNKMLSYPFLLQFLRSIREFFPVQFLFIWQSLEQKNLVDEWISDLDKEDLSIGKLSIPLWYHIMLQSALVIGVDSSSLHLAAIGNIPTYTFFGPSNGEVYVPQSNKHGYYQSSCPHKIYFIKRCPILRTCKDGGCLQRLDAREVFEHFLEWAKKDFSAAINPIDSK